MAESVPDSRSSEIRGEREVESPIRRAVRDIGESGRSRVPPSPTTGLGRNTSGFSCIVVEIVYSRFESCVELRRIEDRAGSYV